MSIMDLPAEKIIRNSMVTPDGTTLESRGRHDYCSHTDDNGELYMIDGGLAYLRRSVNKVPATDTSIYYFHGHEVVREHFEWGTRGPEGDQPKTYVKLKDMDDDHLQAIIDDNYGFAPLMKHELMWRKSAGARKLVRQQDIKRIEALKERYSHSDKVLAELDDLLLDIVPKFNENEFNNGED